ncbi:MAG: hypothetical protein ACM3NQ_24960 [Bacteroidales bacterium]
MRPDELLGLLRDFTIEKVGLKRRHEAGARLVGDYDFNNTYQYVINREEAHLDWLRRAIAGLGGTLPETIPEPEPPTTGKGRERQAAIIADDVRLMDDAIARWRGRIEQVNDSRQKLMLRVVIGEMLEQKRFFEQAAAGREDLLGRRTSPSRPQGTVLSDRWVG